MSWIKERILSWFKFLILKIVKIGLLKNRLIKIPKHIAFIMDGSRRYAKKQKMADVQGQSRGFKKLTETMNWCADLGITELTVYAFSIENFKRSKEEVDGFLELTRQQFKILIKEKDKLMEDGLCIRVIGNFSLIREDVRKLMIEVMTMTKDNNKAFLNIAFAYTSRDEITHVIKDIAKGVKDNEILPEDVNKDLIANCLYTYKSPNPDLLIRTSKVTRLSDPPMRQISDTCIYFTNVLWPEFGFWDFFWAIFYYQKCYPDLQRIAKVQNLKPITHNNRISMYINNLHHKRQAMIEKQVNHEN